MSFDERIGALLDFRPFAPRTMLLGYRVARSVFTFLLVVSLILLPFQREQAVIALFSGLLAVESAVKLIGVRRSGRTVQAEARAGWHFLDRIDSQRARARVVRRCAAWPAAAAVLIPSALFAAGWDHPKVSALGALLLLACAGSSYALGVHMARRADAAERAIGRIVLEPTEASDDRR